MEVPAGSSDNPLGFENPGISADLYESGRSRLVPSIKRGVIIVIAAALVTTAFGLLGYRPLSGTAPAAVNGPTATLNGDRAVVAFKDGASFDYSFTVRNDGRWGITVTDIELPRHGAIEDAVLLVTPPGAAGARQPGSFALGSGESALLTIRATFGACETPMPVDGRPAWDREIVRYRVLGLAREMVVQLPYRLVIDSANAPRC